MEHSAGQGAGELLAVVRPLGVAEGASVIVLDSEGRRFQTLCPPNVPVGGTFHVQTVAQPPAAPRPPAATAAGASTDSLPRGLSREEIRSLS